LIFFPLQISSSLILNLLIICAFIPYGLSQEGGIELTEEYIDDESLPESNLEDGLSSTSKPNNTNEVNHKKAHFSEDRFTKLFQSRRQRPRPSPLSPRFASKPKPTLPSFIKNTPPIIKVQPTPVPNQRSATQKTTTTSSTRTPSRGSSNTNRRNQSNSNRSNNQSTASPVSTTDSSRRRFGSNSNTKRNNSTIPATKPKRI
jgi:hypothetical protein